MKFENSTYPVSPGRKAEELLDDKQDSSQLVLISNPDHPIQPDLLEQADTATTLYDLSPAGYYTLSPDGIISQLNLRGAKILGKERPDLLGINFRQFVARDNKNIFTGFLKQIFKTRSLQSCELKLSLGTDVFTYVHLDGVMFKDQERCLVTAIDITEQKKREEILKNTQTNLISLINNRDESIWSVDNNYHLITYNNFFRDECFAVWSMEVKKGMNVLHIFPSHLHQLWKQKYARAMSGRRVVFEYSNQVGNELHDYEVFLNPVVTDKKVTGVTALSVVVTWRKQAEEALRRSEERHRLLADNASDVIMTLDINGHFTYISPSVKKLTGYTSAEMINCNLKEIYTHESAETVRMNLKQALESIQSGQTMGEFRNELEQWCKDGSKIWVDVTTSAMYNRFGEFVGILCVARDITERKMAEQALRRSEIKYRSLYESIIDGFACIDTEGRIIDTNSSFEQMVGHSREDLVKLHFSDIVPEKWHAIEQCIIKEQIIPHGYSEVYEEEFIRKDGTVFPVEIRIFIVKNELGENERMCAIVRDITEQKRVKDALAKSEKLYHALFEESNAVMFLIDPFDGSIVDANAAACNYYGYTRDKLNGFNISDINMLPQLQIKNSMSEVVQGKQLRYNFRHKLANSNVRDVEVYSCPIEIDGRVLLHSIVHDITDRKIAEEALIASESRFRNLLQNVSAVAVQGYSPDGIVQYWNHASELLYGYSAQEAIGRNIIRLIVAPQMQEDMMRSIHQMVETGLPAPTSEMSLVRRNGSHVDVYASHAIVQMPGRAPELFCFDIDLTERKRAEEKVRERDQIFSQFLENSPIYIFFKDEKLRMLNLSRNYETRIGRKMEEMIGKKVDDLFPAPVAERMTESSLLSVREKVKIELEEEINGRYYSIIKFPIQIEGKPTGLAGFTIDITERKRAENALKESEARLQELNATKDKFFSIIAHDLKGPFNSIMGFSELLMRQIQDRDYEGIDRYATIIQNSSQRAMSLLLNLLEWSRSQTGNMEFHPERINISTLAREAAELFHDAALQKAIVIYLEIHPNTFVFVDRKMISTILRNLISNAIKFTHDEGEIILSARPHENECLVTVSDNGMGIKKEAIDKLFRIDTSYSTLGTRDEAGTGLGLILCKDFIDKHKGRIWVESERSSKEERGSTKFYFTIPLAEAAE
ncbi:MAG TPA: PAS domain S-box protein [Prolixibacteraceae bacterium]|nr:PAS domain S-box protein [Prolixibacteraceae bacterium]